MIYRKNLWQIEGDVQRAQRGHPSLPILESELYTLKGRLCRSDHNLDRVIYVEESNTIKPDSR
ncbi:hypothetical protein [Rhodohalobacter sulfatireducens]|uniref:Uncharacterized protein n=1 Tax=Rhodohalobacter sulfatireducens TaxID=2911366 RepID=A0ABS9K9C6_9BACT|nr:hypothetical protein [Rhodohalobacter sulfatireducens]MCG2587441.1 hypothetical protein [Rhodohalobacter sulfatireducens]